MTTLSCSASGIFAICCDLTRPTITRLARIFQSTRTPRCREQYTPLVALCLRPFLADSIICMCVFDFRQAQDAELDGAAERFGALADRLNLLGGQGRRLTPGQVGVRVLCRDPEGRLRRSAEEQPRIWVAKWSPVVSLNLMRFRRFRSGCWGSLPLSPNCRANDHESLDWLQSM